MVPFAINNPKNGRYARINDEYKNIPDDVVSYMKGRGYRLESEQDENITFRVPESEELE